MPCPLTCAFTTTLERVVVASAKYDTLAGLLREHQDKWSEKSEKSESGSRIRAIRRSTGIFRAKGLALTCINKNSMVLVLYGRPGLRERNSLRSTIWNVSVEIERLSPIFPVACRPDFRLLNSQPVFLYTSDSE